MKKKDIAEKDNNTLKALLFGVVFAFGLSLAGIFIFSWILYSTGVSEDSAGTVILTITLLSDFFGGFVCARIKKSGGLLFGAIAGAIYFLVLFIISLALGLRDAAIPGLSTMVFGVMSSALGGVIGVNIGTKK